MTFEDFFSAFQRSPLLSLGFCLVACIANGLIWGVALVLGKLTVVALQRFVKSLPPNVGFFISCGIVVALGVVLALVYQGEFTQLTLMKAGVVYFLAPYLVGLGAWGLAAIMRRGKLAPIRRATLVWLIFAAAMGLSFALGDGINRWKVEAAQNYVVRAMPVLDQIRIENGSFPERLPASLGNSPVLLQYFGAWQGDRSNFSFLYSDPSQFDAEYILTASDRSWKFLPD